MGINNGQHPLAVYDLAAKIRDCILPFLEGTSQGIPNRVCITTGEIAWDDCECGQLAISAQTKNEANGPNDPRSGSATPARPPCGPPLMQFDYLISMTRCAPSGAEDSEGNPLPPTCAQLDEAARIAIEDAWAVMAGVVCCLNEAVTTRLPNGTKLFHYFIVGTQTFVGPQGMCQGSELPVSIIVDNGCYPCDVS